MILLYIEKRISQEGVVLMCYQQSRLTGLFKLVTHTMIGYQTFDAYLVCIKSLFFVAKARKAALCLHKAPLAGRKNSEKRSLELFVCEESRRR